MRRKRPTLAQAAFGELRTFRNLKGVLSTAVGYAGGTERKKIRPTRCLHLYKTGHAEVVEVEFDPSQIAYDELLDVFWSNTIHDIEPARVRMLSAVSLSDFLSFARSKWLGTSRKKIDASGRFRLPVVTQN